MPIASLTKIWTALIVVENAELSEKVIVSRKAAYSEGSSIYLEEGETTTVETLLYGLMLRSGNDAAMALAEHVGGSEEGFVFLMNERAREAGLTRTMFQNPSGLHHPMHLSTAYDTARMLQVAMENKTFAKIASTQTYKADLKNTPSIVWKNKQKLLFTDVGAISGKTGYTKVAGRTLATYFDRDDKRFVVVTLSESNDWQVHTHLADMVDEQYEMKTVIPKGTYKTANHKIKVEKDVKLLLKEDEEVKLKHTLIIPRLVQEKIAVWQIRLKNSQIHAFRTKYSDIK
jgi:serine-type D-Ala-D-Ala carboxypeptidase (penicillin-binding protein 5/6)